MTPDTVTDDTLRASLTDPVLALVWNALAIAAAMGGHVAGVAPASAPALGILAALVVGLVWLWQVGPP